ncbi:hypothetical protein [Chelatococcus sp. XZ-Ab1]|uniref:hypothetical protein n=1 Tax=Chelatococcus sp. XZ-Ab1 TaxID=3034027 RepID=UPI0023E3F4D5|nr:hypothetical protein [Chelatococcus sp. XZ-Ab1]
MSLTSLAIRLATIRALKGRTLAGDNVFDSTIKALDALAPEATTPFIIVTTDDDQFAIEGRDLLAGDHRLELVIEIATAKKLAVEDGPDVLTIPASDAGLEASLNILGWQIARALAADGGEWSDLWRSIVVKVHSIASRRGADETNGVRYAARQFIYTVDHIAEPLPGTAPHEGDAWARIIAALKADPEFGSIGRIVEAEIVSNELQPWERVRAALGLADDEATWISDRPFEDGAPLAALDLTDGFTIDAQTAADADGPEETP